MSFRNRLIFKLAHGGIAGSLVALFSTGACAESSISSGAHASAPVQVGFKIVIPPYVGVALDESGRQRAVSNIRQFSLLEDVVDASGSSSVAESKSHRLIAYP